jgi:hypothetical protein
MELVRPVRRLLMPIHQSMRHEKVRLFFDLLKPSPSDTLLDVGGSIGMSGEFSELYNFFPRMATLNLEPEPVGCGHAEFISGDACHIPLPSFSFDYVFSNAVIEHVGDFEKQTLMASEIIRMARKGFFVATPNRHFPIDPHSYLPFFHLLSQGARRKLVCKILKGYIGQYEDYWMLSASEMRKLFPGAGIVVTAGRTAIVAVSRRTSPGPIDGTQRTKPVD